MVFGNRFVFGSKDPLTGYYRTGCCETGPDESLELHNGLCLWMTCNVFLRVFKFGENAS